MDENLLNKQLDKLWNKVTEKSQADNPQAGFASAFESAQQEIRDESLKLLQVRFEKEKEYWQNLVNSKEEAIAKTQKEVEKEIQRNLELKKKIEDLQTVQSQILQQSFQTLDLQKRSLNVRLDQLEKELSESHKEILSLNYKLKDERDFQEKLKKEWEQKELQWAEERDERELEINRVREDLFKKREEELKEITTLEATVKNTKNELSENKLAFETEKTGLQNLLNEKENLALRLQQELGQAKTELETERTERRLASVERERQSQQEEQDKKRLVEQMLARENKIKELQDSLEKMLKEKAGLEEGVRKKTEELEMQDESLQKRREDWIESIKTQVSQQLSISGKVVDLIQKIEGGDSTLQLKSSLKPPATPAPLAADASVPGARPSIKYSLLNQVVSGSESLLKPITRTFSFGVLKGKEGFVLAIAGLVLFTTFSLYMVLESEGRKAVRAQSYLQQGNDQFSRGEIVESFRSLKKAYDLDPENSIIKNSFTLVLGEVANREYRDGKFDEALKHTELLNQIIGEDPEVMRLHETILKALHDKDIGK